MSEILVSMAFAAIIGAVYTFIYIWHSNNDPGKEPASLHCGRCGSCPGKNNGSEEKCGAEIKHSKEEI